METSRPFDRLAKDMNTYIDQIIGWDGLPVGSKQRTDVPVILHRIQKRWHKYDGHIPENADRDVSHAIQLFVKLAADLGSRRGSADQINRTIRVLKAWRRGEGPILYLSLTL